MIQYRCIRCGRFVTAVDTVFKPFDGLTKVAPHIGYFFRAEYEHNNDQYYQPMSNA